MGQRSGLWVRGRGIQIEHKKIVSLNPGSATVCGPEQRALNPKLLRGDGPCVLVHCKSPWIRASAKMAIIIITISVHMGHRSHIQR